MKDWTKVKEELAYDGYRKIIRRSFTLPDGHTKDFDIVDSPLGWAVLFAMTEDNKVICFVQFRPGPEKVLYELPGGGIDPGETPIECARRELLEETGYAGELTELGSYYRDAYVDGVSHMYVAKNCKKIKEIKPDPDEPGEVQLLTIEEFKKKLFEGQLTDTTLGYAGLHHLGLLAD